MKTSCARSKSLHMKLRKKLIFMESSSFPSCQPSNSLDFGVGVCYLSMIKGLMQVISMIKGVGILENI